jgi:RHS repeat-associated protein
MGYYNRNRGLKEGDRVYLTIGGKREVFQIRLVPAEREGLTLPRMYDLVFDPVGTTSSRLTYTGSGSAKMTFITDGGGVIRNLAGIPLDLSSNFSMSYYSTKLLLTTEQKIQYEINPATGKIDRIGTDLYMVRRRLTGSDVVQENANPTEYLELADSYIKSSYGLRITFERDSKGRIVAAVDPDGNKVRYAYDSKGDLVSVTDREGHTTRFEYSDTRKHYLTKVIDPLNRPVMRNEYDAMGRLTKVFDANGNAINMSFDPENQIQIVTDPLGNSTTYEYDDRGNTVQIVDALGGVERFEYDAQGNVTKQIDQLGNVSTFKYDASGNLTETINPKGHSESYTYSNGKITSIKDLLGGITTLKYDSKGNMTRYIAANGSVGSVLYDNAGNPTSMSLSGKMLLELEWDSQNRPTKYVDEDGVVYNYVYDIHGRVVRETRRVGGVEIVVSRTYNKNGQVLTESISDGNSTSVTTYTYGSDGRILVKDVDGNKSFYFYDPVGNLIKLVEPDGSFLNYTYDKLGRITEAKDSNGEWTKTEYDQLGRIVKQTFSNGIEQSQNYDLLGRVLSMTVTDGNSSRTLSYTYDEVGNVIEQADSLYGVTGSKQYNPMGSLASTTDPLGRTVQYVYGSNNQIPVQIILADGSTFTQELSAPNETTGAYYFKQVDSMGNTVITSFDRNSNVTSVSNSRGTTEYVYDDIGRILAIKDAMGRQTTYTHEIIDNNYYKITKTNPLGEISYDMYDKRGNLVESKDIQGVVTSFEYDQFGRMIRINRAGDVTTYNYFNDEVTITRSTGVEIYRIDDNGRITRFQNNAGEVIETEYDSNGRVSRVQYSDGRFIAYTYVGETRLVATVSSNGGTTKYTYNMFGSVSSVEDINGVRTEYEYDAVGQLTTIRYGNGLVESRTYNSLGMLMSIETRDGDAIKYSESYTRDKVGNILSITYNDGRRVRYTYDTSYQLVGEFYELDGSITRVITYTYDAVGNRTQMTDSVEGTTIYLYDSANRLTKTISGGTETIFTYDGRGNLISEYKDDNNYTIYEWNAMNLLSRVRIVRDGEVTVTEYGYDHLGNRIEQVVNGVRTKYTIDIVKPFSQVREESNISGVTTYNYSIWDQKPLSMYKDGNTYYFQGNHQGSVSLLIDENKQVVNRYTYDGYGRILGRQENVLNPFNFTGEMSDANGLVYLRARYYKPEIGRFLSEDPYSGNERNPVSQHPYLYVENNPIVNTDPSGALTLTSLISTQKIESILKSIQNPSYLYKLDETEGKISAFISILQMISVSFEVVMFILNNPAFSILAGGNPYVSASTDVLGSISISGYNTSWGPFGFGDLKVWNLPKSLAKEEKIKKIAAGWSNTPAYPSIGDPSKVSGAAASTAAALLTPFFFELSAFIGVDGDDEKRKGRPWSVSGIKNKLSGKYNTAEDWSLVKVSLTTGREITLLESKIKVNVGSVDAAAWKLVIGAEGGGTIKVPILNPLGFSSHLPKPSLSDLIGNIYLQLAFFGDAFKLKHKVLDVKVSLGKLFSKDWRKSTEIKFMNMKVLP